jgi:hypothetical protein
MAAIPMTPAPTLRRWLSYLLLTLVVVITLIGIAFGWATYELNRMRQRAEVDAKERIRSQIAQVKTGKDRQIVLSNEVDDFEMTCFISAQREFDETDDYELEVWYSHNVDDLLRQTSGLRGARSLVLYKTDVSDAGLEFVVLMPDLKKINFSPAPRGRLTEAGIAKFRAKLPHCSIKTTPNK